MNLSIVKTILFKEMVDTLRDKRTLVAMVGIPIVLYPLIVILSSQIAIVQLNRLEETSSKVAVIADEPAAVENWLASIELVQVESTGDPRADLEAGNLDAVVAVEGPVGDTLDHGGTVALRIEYDITESASRKAAGRVFDGLIEKRNAILKERLDDEGLEESFARPLDIEQDNVAPPSKQTGSVLGMILPMIIVVMLGAGAFYPAIDLTAGEKERGTFETLLSTPTSKIDIVAGKFLTVFLLCMFTGLLNLASMSATLLFQFSQLLEHANRDGRFQEIEIASLSFESVLAIFLVLVPLAFFISAVMMTISVFARNFKEAQNFVTPFFIAILLPAGMSAIPDIELSRATQFVPIGNAALLFRDLMTGEATIEMVFLVFVCTAVYAALAIVIASWIFQREEVILAEDRGIPLTLRRDEFTPQSVPTPGAAFGLFAVVLLLIFYGGTYAQSKNIHAGLAITEYAIILAPVLLFLWFVRIDLRSALNLRVPRPGAALGTVFIAPAWVVLVIQIGIWHDSFMPVPKEAMDAFFTDLVSIADTTTGLLVLLFLIALSPAICEEALFRGALLSSLRNRIPNWAVILTLGIAFGLFHLSIYRFIVTGASGLVLTYVALRARSIYPACFAHFVINASAILVQMGKAPQQVLDMLENVEAENVGLPFPLLAAALAVFIVGVAIVEVEDRVMKDPGL